MNKLLFLSDDYHIINKDISQGIYDHIKRCEMVTIPIAHPNDVSAFCHFIDELVIRDLNPMNISVYCADDFRHSPQLHHLNYRLMAVAQEVKVVTNNMIKLTPLFKRKLIYHQFITQLTKLPRVRVFRE